MDMLALKTMRVYFLTELFLARIIVLVMGDNFILCIWMGGVGRGSIC